MTIRRQNGFTMVQNLMITVVLLVIILVGIQVLIDSKSKPKSSSTTTKTTTTNSVTKDWISYCSDFGGLCLRYPKDWTFSTSSTPTYSSNNYSQTGTTEQANIVSPSGNVQVVYNPSEIPPDASGTIPFTLLSLTSPSNSSSFYIVSGIAHNDSGDTTYHASLYITSSEQGAADGLGKTKTKGDFSLNNTDNFFQNSAKRVPNIFQVISVGAPENQGFSTTFTDLDNAKAWFSDPEVKTAAQILDSLFLSGT